MIVELTENEFSAAMAAAARKCLSSRTTGTRDLREGHLPGLYLDAIGMAAEAAFCKAAGAFLDLETRPRHQPWDCRVGGVTVDVKCTAHTNGKLNSPAAARGKPDAYVLMVPLAGGQEWRWRFAGWAWYEDLRAEKNRSVLKAGACESYSLPQSELNASLDELRAAGFERLLAA